MHAAANEVGALWGAPRIEVPRSLTDLLAAASFGDLGAEHSWRCGTARYQPTRPACTGYGCARMSRLARPCSAQRQWSRGRTRSFSLITFVAEPAAGITTEPRQAFVSQSYPGWEWIIVATDDSMPDVSQAIARIGRDDRYPNRQRSVRKHARGRMERGAARGTSGNLRRLLDQHDLLAPAALYKMARVLERSPDCDLLYSDEDRVSRRTLRHEPRFKPDWSPELLLASNYIGRLAMFRVAAAVRSRRFSRSALVHAEEWDLFLRLSRSTARIRRVPRCLYHRDETATAGAEDGTEAVLQDHCRTLGLQVAVTRSHGAARVVWNIQGQPMVSIVIPNRDAAAVFRQCVRVFARTRAIRAANSSSSTTGAPRGKFSSSIGRSSAAVMDASCRSIGPSTFPRPATQAQPRRSGELLLFLNNDIEVIRAGLARRADTLGSAAGRRHCRSEAPVPGSDDSARRSGLWAGPRRPHLREGGRRRIRRVRLHRVV